MADPRSAISEPTWHRRTVVCLWNFDDDTMSELSFRTMDDPMDSSPPLYTGDYSLAVKKGYVTSVQVQVEQRQPLPITILAVMPEYEVLP